MADACLELVSERFTYQDNFDDSNKKENNSRNETEITRSDTRESQINSGSLVDRKYQYGNVGTVVNVENLYLTLNPTIGAEMRKRFP